MGEGPLPQLGGEGELPELGGRGGETVKSKEKRQGTDKVHYCSINLLSLVASPMKSWDWKGRSFSVTPAMRLRNLRSSSCAVESNGGSAEMCKYYA